MAPSVFYIIGDEAVARSKELGATIDELLGTEDRSLALESFDLSDADGEEARTRIIEDAVYSLSSPPFLTSLRVVVIRDIGAATTENITSLVQYLENPSPTSFLVAVQGGGRISTTLTKAWKSISEQRGAAREKIDDVYSRVTREHKLTFEPGVREAIFAHCGQDATKLTLMVERLAQVYGDSIKLSLENVHPYLGEAGNVAIYELANEICSGKTKRALEMVSRMMRTTSAENPKPMHPLQIISLLANHFRKLAILDNPSIRNKNEAHAALGGKGSPYGSQKNWELSRRLGSQAITACIELIGAADVAVKGGNALEADVIIELLLISLCDACDAGADNLNTLRTRFSDALFV